MQVPFYTTLLELVFGWWIVSCKMVWLSRLNLILQLFVSFSLSSASGVAKQHFSTAPAEKICSCLSALTYRDCLMRIMVMIFFLASYSFSSLTLCYVTQWGDLFLWCLYRFPKDFHMQILCFYLRMLVGRRNDLKIYMAWAFALISHYS